MAEDESQPVVAVECPGCGVVVEVGAGAGEVVCPGCGTMFVVAGVDDRAREEAVARRESELDGLRMRHVIVQRRAAARSRTYAVLGAGVCAMGAVKLVMMARREVGLHGWGMGEVAYGVVAVLAIVGAVYFVGRAAYWGRESRAGVIPEPEGEPDFSTLGDGSQRARDLEDIR
jgi:uncharacterized Zn finger protein (UPF0148 family)